MILLFIHQADCLAWGNKKTHPTLTAKAVEVNDVADSYLKNQLGMSQGLQTRLTWDFPNEIKQRMIKGEAKPDTVTRTIQEWLKAGSIIEDEDGRYWPIRSRHHFHAPIATQGRETF